MLHPEEEYGRQILSMIESLVIAVTEAGGAIAITPKYLRETSLEDFILMMASNGVRFTHIEDKVTSVPEISFDDRF